MITVDLHLNSDANAETPVPLTVKGKWRGPNDGNYSVLTISKDPATVTVYWHHSTPEQLDKATNQLEALNAVLTGIRKHLEAQKRMIEQGLMVGATDGA